MEGKTELICVDSPGDIVKISGTLSKPGLELTYLCFFSLSECIVFGDNLFELNLYH